MSNRFLDRNGHRLLLLLILVIAVALRLYGQDWDDGHYLHPDERFIASVSSGRVAFPEVSELDSLFDPASSPINPRRDGDDGEPLSFAYGTLPVYVQGVASWTLNLVSDRDWSNYDNLYRVGRTLSVLMDLATLIFTYLIARRLFTANAALIAAALYALLVLPIQLSHFFTVDVWLTAFVTGALWALIRYVDRPTLTNSLIVGAFVGCACATKASIPSLLVLTVLVYALVFFRSRNRSDIVAASVAGALVALAAFTLFEPYALLRWDAFSEDIRNQARIVQGEFDVPFTRQFIGLTPGLYELKNLFAFTTGPAFILVGLAGTLWGGIAAFRRRDLALAIVPAWVIAYVPILLYTEARFLRYALPILPALAILGAGLFAFALRDVRWRQPARVAAGVTLAVTAIWAFGFVSIYGRENPRLDASKWIYENVPPGSTLAAETWDDALPLRIDDQFAGQYTIQSLDIYSDQPPEEKTDYLYETLASNDFIVMSSDRVIESVDNLPWRYGVQNEYYRRLLDGQLGYRLVYDGPLRPELFGYRYDDSSADESFTVYDHPRVRIFEKVEQLSADEFRSRLLWGINQPWEPTRTPSEQWLRLDQPVDEIDTTADASYNGFATGRGWFALLPWLAALEVIGLAALPLAAALFRNSPDRGALSARLLGVLVVGWFVWFGASVGFWPSTTWTVLIIVTLVGLAGWGWTWRARQRGAANLPALPSGKIYALSSALYLGIFALLLSFRAIYPDFWQTYLGGEKPFELAYLRAIARSTSFPAYDPWFADGIINYYYYGWHLVAMVTKLSGVGVSLGFQFATPTIAALLATQVAALGFIIRGAVLRSGRRAVGIATAAGALLLVMFAGNLDAIRQVAELGISGADQFDFWGSTRVIEYTINEFPYFSLIWADVHPHVINMPVIVLLLTLLLQVALNLRRAAAPSNSILPAAPLTIGICALVLGTIIATNTWDAPLAIALVLATFVYAGLLVSRWVAMTMAACGLAVVALGFALFAPYHSRFYSVAKGVAIADAGSALGEFLLVWGIPLAVIGLVMLSAALHCVRERRDVRDAWLAPVFLLLPAALLLLNDLFQTNSLLNRMYDDWPPSLGSMLIATALTVTVVAVSAAATRPTRFHPLALALVGLLVIVAGGLVLGRPAAGLAFGFAAGSAMFAIATWRIPSSFFPWAMIVVASLTVASVEVVYVVDDLQNGPWQRMNTVFKFSLFAWLLFGSAAGILLVRLWDASLRLGGTAISHQPLGIVARPEHDVRTGRVRECLARAPALALVLPFAATAIVLLGLVYPVFGTPTRLEQTMPTTPSAPSLDGYAWMKEGWILNATGERVDFSGDLQAIDWLNEHATDGNPVIVEAAIGPYRGNGSRISSATGLPAVIGWDRHQRQQRYPEGITRRMSDVETLYNTTDLQEKMELLRRYRARYVIVGDVERLWNPEESPAPYASAAGLAAFEALVGNGLSIAFDAEGTRIYQVDDFPMLEPAPGAYRDL